MAPDSEGLYPIANTDRPGQRADIVFVHGLTGDAHSTWRHSREGRAGHFFWPQALGEDLPDCAIWSLGYAASLGHWFGTSGIAIQDRAKDLMATLRSQGIGQRPLIFIAHSIGGLEVKEIILRGQASDADGWRQLVAQVSGVVFCGTPHRGASLASAAKILSTYLRLPPPSQPVEMDPALLDRQHDEFVAWQRRTGVPVESYVERVSLLTQFLVNPLPLGLVVPVGAGDPDIPGCECHPVPADHVMLAKPKSRNSDVYGGVLRFIRQALKAPLPQPAASLPDAAPGRKLAAPPPALPQTEETGRRTSNIDLSRIGGNASERLVGREAGFMLLDQAWRQVPSGDGSRENAPQPKKSLSPLFGGGNRPHILTIYAPAGEGKTSLVAKWAEALVRTPSLACASAFAWSFHGQGMEGPSNACADLFLREALVFFGGAEDRLLADSPRPAEEKGKRLAALLATRRALLVLDGVEPLQYPPDSPLPGQLKDPGLSALLRQLAVRNGGLCVVTSRQPLADLKNHAQGSAPQVKLKRLSRAAGVDVLSRLVSGTDQERAALVEAAQGHALTLNLLGAYLRDAHGGDIRRADRVRLDEAGTEDHALRCLDAYAAWLDNDAQNRPALALLRLTGLFDRPADAGCWEALVCQPPIPGLTNALAGLDEAQQALALNRLAESKLLTVKRDSAGRLLAVDAHPLVRGHFATKLREDNPAGWREAHARLYRHLRDATPDKPQPSLEDLQPLYQAVAHGCLAGLQRQACGEVYIARIVRRNEAYTVKRLGAFGAELEAIAGFFDEPWHRISPELMENRQAWLLNEAAVRLRGVGRLAEALVPMRVGLEQYVQQGNWSHAARVAGNLSGLALTLGEVVEAVAVAGQSVGYADCGGDAFIKTACHTALADALHQAGRAEPAAAQFQAAEAAQAEHQPDSPLLYSLPGFRYCELLLAAAERAAWRSLLSSAEAKPAERADQADLPLGEGGAQPEELKAACHAVAQRAETALQATLGGSRNLLDIALNHLTLARAKLYAACLNPPAKPPADIRNATDAAVDGLRQADRQDHLPRGLLALALQRRLENRLVGPGGAQDALDEALEIAERGPMPLFLADIHLHRARLFGTLPAYPWQSPAEDLRQARRLIDAYGYGRRRAELTDAEAFFGRNA